jgi:superfamily II DNA or RNA helicase
MNIKIVRLDQGIWLGPTTPYIINYLRYSHRSLKTGPQWQRVNDFQEVRLYNLDTENDGLSTLPGFFHHLLELIEKNMDTYSIQDMRTPIPDIDWGRVKEIGLRDYQCEPVVEFLTKGMDGGGIINATGGWGKTFAQAVTYAAWNKLNTILAIPIAQVVKQTAIKFKKLFPEKHVGQMHAQINDLSQDITVTTFDSLQKCSLEKCQLLLVDEVQGCTGDSFQNNLALIKPIRTFGYTATDKGLFNNADKVLKGMFGERLIYIPYREAENVGAVVPGVVYFLEMPPDCMLGAGDSMDDKFSNGIKKCEIRNKFIAQTCALIPDKRQTIVFVDHVKDHLVELMKMMPEGTKYVHRNANKKQIGAYALSPKQQDAVIKGFCDNDFQYLVATDAFRAGVDVPNCRVIVQAAGGSSEIEVLQEAFRGSRTLSKEDQERLGVGPKTHFNVIDVWDAHDDTLLRMSEKRLGFYKDQGWKIRFVKTPQEINWNEF